jgi:predicted transglutaminase-like cysteine proteinase
VKILIVIAVIAVVLGGAVFIYSEGGLLSKKYDINVLYGEGGNFSGAGTYEEGSTATLTATPNEGYSFVGWYEDSVFYSSSSTIKVKVDSSHTFAPTFEKKTYLISVSSNYSSAGKISGGGSVQHGNSIVLKASVNSGYSFIGWYDGFTFLSSDLTYYHTATKTATITATYSIIHDASFTVNQSSPLAPATLIITSTYNVEISYRSWTITDAISGKIISNSASYGNIDRTISTWASEGKALTITQTVTYSDGQQATSSLVKVVDEKVTKHFSWRYQKDSWYSIITDFIQVNNGSVTWDVPMNFSWYYSALTSSVPRAWSYNTNMSVYVTANDSFIKSLAQSLMNFTSKMSDIDRVNFVLKFVQSLPYQYDIDGKGKTEYWKLPAETLWEGKGDCEDHAFLFASLVKAMGYNVVIYHLPSHLAAGVAVPGGSGYYTTVNGIKYYYCEATATSSAGWFNYADVGYKPSGYVIEGTYAV